MWTRIGRLFIVFILWCSLVIAEDVSFQASVNANKISMQDMVELTLTIVGVKEIVPPIDLPAIDGFDARFVGPSTKYTIINGVSSSERSFVYHLFPSKTGHFQIPSITTTISGSEYKSLPIDIEVVDRLAEPKNSEDAQVSQELDIHDQVFMRVSIEPKEVYVGEQTPLKMKVYVKGLTLQLAAAPAVKPVGFVADSTANMQKSKEVVNGMNYDSLRFDTNIYPTQTGPLKVGPFEAVGELVYRAKQKDDFFSDFFANTETRPINLTAPEISINVLPLPDSGRPSDFSGAVGQYDFKASLGPASVKVGDPLTLRMTISGQGRLKGLTMPTFNESRFKTYEPQLKDGENSLTSEQIIIPTSKDIVELPAIQFSYFDPQEKKYKTITQGPFAIKVIAPAAGEEFKAYGFVDKTKTPAEKSIVISPHGVKQWIDQGVVFVQKLFKDLRFWLFIVMFGILWFVFNFWQGFQNRLAKDEVFAREWKADAKAKELLKTTKDCLGQKNSEVFYTSLYKTLNDYLADKMHIPMAGLQWEQLETYLKGRSIDSLQLEILKSLFERCDLVRFASATIPSEEMTQDFQKLQQLMTYLFKLLK